MFTLSMPADNDRGPQYMEQALAAIHQANPRRLAVEFGFAFHQKNVVLTCGFPACFAATAIGQLSAHYPASTVERIGEAAMPPTFRTWSVELRLHPDLFPIRRHTQFDDPLNCNVADPLTGIFAALTATDSPRYHPAITLKVRPAKSRRVRQARRAVQGSSGDTHT